MNKNCIKSIFIIRRTPLQIFWKCISVEQKKNGRKFLAFKSQVFYIVWIFYSCWLNTFWINIIFANSLNGIIKYCIIMTWKMRFFTKNCQKFGFEELKQTLLKHTFDQCTDLSNCLLKIDQLHCFSPCTIRRLCTKGP